MTPPNRDSCDCYPVAEVNAVAFATTPGAFFIEPDGSAIHIKLPDMSYTRLPLDGSRGWQWDGNREKPTITPSILQQGTRGDGQVVELWHGLLRAGRLESC